MKRVQMKNRFVRRALRFCVVQTAALALVLSGALQQIPENARGGVFQVFQPLTAHAATVTLTGSEYNLTPDGAGLKLVNKNDASDSVTLNGTDDIAINGNEVTIILNGQTLTTQSIKGTGTNILRISGPGNVEITANSGNAIEVSNFTATGNISSFHVTSQNGSAIKVKQSIHIQDIDNVVLEGNTSGGVVEASPGSIYFSNISNLTVENKNTVDGNGIRLHADTGSGSSENLHLIQCSGSVKSYQDAISVGGQDGEALLLNGCRNLTVISTGGNAISGRSYVEINKCSNITAQGGGASGEGINSFDAGHVDIRTSTNVNATGVIGIHATAVAIRNSTVTAKGTGRAGILSSNKMDITGADTVVTSDGGSDPADDGAILAWGGIDIEAPLGIEEPAGGKVASDTYGKTWITDASDNVVFHTVIRRAGSQPDPSPEPSPAPTPASSSGSDYQEPVISWKKLPGSVTDGATSADGTAGISLTAMSSQPLSITPGVHADGTAAGGFLSLKIDDAFHGPNHFTLNGNVITVLPSILNTLGEGVHVIRINYDNHTYTEVTVTVLGVTRPDTLTSVDAPQTSDPGENMRDIMPVLFAAALLVSCAAFFARHRNRFFS